MRMLFFISIFTFLLSGAEINVIKDFNKAKELAKIEKKDVMLMIVTKSCPWCVKMKNTTFKDEKILNIIKSRYIFVELNKDSDEIPHFARFVPTIFIYQNEELIDEIIGFKNSEEFLKILEIN